MESHVLNTYHCARYRSIGHKLLRTSECSEGSCKTSPEYTQGQYHWTTNQTINMTRSQETSSDEEENIEVQELIYEDDPQVQEAGVVEEQVLVEGDDYDVIQVYAVDPDLDLEASSDDEDHGDFAISNTTNNKHVVKEGYLNVEDNSHRKAVHESQGMDGFHFDLDTPVVSNVDEYFIKEDKDKDIFSVKDEPVVNDVDEYFIKEDKTNTPNVHDFFKVEKSEELVPKPVNVDEFFVTNAKPPENVGQISIDQNVDNTDDVPINESDLEVLPNIEELKRFLLEDMSHTNLKNVQRSCSLPQSPMHNICLDIDDTRTCLSFEDLDIDLSDLTFDNVKEKSGSSAKSDDIPRTLTDDDVNSFLITSTPLKKETIPSQPLIEDDLSPQDMEIENPVESSIDPVIIPQVQMPIKIPEPKTSSPIKMLEQKPQVQMPINIPESKTPTPTNMLKQNTSTPIKPTVLNFCIEKSSLKKENSDAKADDDFVDVESCNDTIIPVLAANNLNSLLEQFEATEKLNTKPKKVVKVEEQKVKSVSLTNGMRLQDAGVQLNKTKMRQILMPSTINASVRRSPSPVHSDHDYCSSKKRYSLPNIKGGQSLLKPEVLSSNNKILSSRRRSCRNKRIVYALSSDDESDKNNKIKKSDDSDIKNKKLLKQTFKEMQPIRKKLSVYSPNECKDKGRSNSSVIVKDACKASDTPCSQNSNGSLKLTIKNKSEVILSCDVKDSQKDKLIEKCKSSGSEKIVIKKEKIEPQNIIKSNKSVKKEEGSNKKSVNNNNIHVENCIKVVKEETRPKAENFYTALFSNKQDVQVPQAIQIKSEKRSFEEEISIATMPNKDIEQPQKKKKLNLQEYKMRRCVSSNNSSAQVSPEAIFPDMPNPLNNDKTQKSTPNQTPPNGIINAAEQTNNETPKKIFDPIREASRKILMNNRKQKAEAMRKRDEDIVMSKIPKVQNLQLQPLISDAEMMKIVGMTQPEAVPLPIVEKPQAPADIEEIVLVSIGVNTDEAVFKQLQKSELAKKSESPPDVKSLINFKIKKSDHVLKQNVFDSVKRDRKSPVDDKKQEMRIDKKRFKDITATLQSVKKQVDTKNLSNSLFASIQDVVKKKAPEEENQLKEIDKRSKSNSPKRKTLIIKPTIIREYDVKAEHGEDKIILHLDKDRIKPESTTIPTQTDNSPEFAVLNVKEKIQEKTLTPPRKRNDSDMSMSSDESPVRKKSPKEVERPKSRHARSRSKEKRSRSKERYDKYRRSRSRSRSRSRRRRRPHSRSRSRSRGRFRRYRRSGTPYRRKRRSPYRRRSPSVDRRRDYKRSRSRNDTRSKSPKRRSPLHSVDIKPKSLTPPLPRKPRVSESSYSSTSSSSSSSSSSSGGSSKSRGSRQSRVSGQSRGSSSSYRRDGYRSKAQRSPYSSDDRESNTPVEERRIVFVGKLEKDITKLSLRNQFSKFGPVTEVRLHSKEDGSRYGFVTYKHPRDAWSAVEAASSFPQYDVGFGGRRAFCRQSYADLDGLEAKYTESAFHGAAALPPRRNDAMSFEQMLLEMKKKLSQRKGDKKPDENP